MSNGELQSEADEKTPRNIKVWLLVSQSIAGLILIPWCGLAMFAAMIGWPAVIELEGGWDFPSVTFSLMVCYPLYAIVFAIVAWILYARRQYTSAAIVTILPVLLSLLFFILWLVADNWT